MKTSPCQALQEPLGATGRHPPSIAMRRNNCAHKYRQTHRHIRPHTHTPTHKHTHTHTHTYIQVPPNDFGLLISSAQEVLARNPHTYWGSTFQRRPLRHCICACSVAASYKPPMLVTRVRLPACAEFAPSCRMSRIEKLTGISHGA